jgi:hypothetical protein
MPDIDSPFMAAHTALLRGSYRRWTGTDLLAPDLGPAEAARVLFDAPFAVVSHDTRADPVFTYGNRLALALFEMDWDEFTVLPSRLSAVAEDQGERLRLLAGVGTRGYADNYAGIRISKTGRRFLISDATVWNLIDEAGGYRGQAACIRHWRDLP